MGQSSSKRKLRISGKNKNGKAATSSQAKTDDLNGSIETQQDTDVGDTSGRDRNTSTSSTAQSPTSPTDKKGKRKRFRVGFSLKRSPSGRWSRKKKTPAQNGSRPVSCPEPLREQNIEDSGRPQSLFLEVPDIQEEDNKIETVDLSEDECDKPKSPNTETSAPKPPERSKWKHGSNKKSSGKKKKKEKEKPTAKKDKKKKQKAGETPKDNNDKPEQSHIKMATVTPKETPTEKEKEAVKCEAEIDAAQQETDVESAAASIVAQSVKIAQERLRAEYYNNTPVTKPSKFTTESDGKDIKCVQTSYKHTDTTAPLLSLDDKVTEIYDVEKTNTHATESPTKIAEDIILQIMENSQEVVHELDESSILQKEIDSTASPDYQIPPPLITDNDTQMFDKYDSSEITSYPRISNEAAITVASSTAETLNKNNETAFKVAPSTAESINKNNDTNMTETESEKFAKKMMENIIAAAVKVVHGDTVNREVYGKEDTDETKDSKTTVGSHSANDDNKLEVELGKENEDKLEAEIISKNELSSDGPDVIKDEKSRNVEEKQNKHEKDRPKGETKFKVSQKIIKWFHKKEKQSKAESNIKRDTFSKEEGNLAATDERPQQNLSSDKEQVVESVTCHGGKALITDSKVYRLDKSQEDADLSNNLEYADISAEASVLSNLGSEEVFNPSTSTSPSAASDSNDLASPSSASDKNIGSGFLKKISLGSRLRTAILRKKSSDESDETEKNNCLLTTLSADKSTEFTPPPRKIHKQRLDEQTSPDDQCMPDSQCTPELFRIHTESSPVDGIHQSPFETTSTSLPLTPQSESSAVHVTVDDSGIADLTSPDIDKSDLSCECECNTDSVALAEYEPESVTRNTCATIINLLTTSSTHTGETSDDAHVDVNANDDEDDSLPASKEISQEATVTHAELFPKSMDYYSPLESPTLVSTATIILRTPNTKEQLDVSEETLPTVTCSNNKQQQEVLFVVEDAFATNEYGNSPASTLTVFSVSDKTQPESSQTESSQTESSQTESSQSESSQTESSQTESSQTEHTSDISTLLNAEHSEHQTQEQTELEPPHLRGETLQHLECKQFPDERHSTVDHGLYVKTVAEYHTATCTEPECQIKIIEEYHIGFIDESEQSSSRSESDAELKTNDDLKEYHTSNETREKHGQPLLLSRDVINISSPEDSLLIGREILLQKTQITESNQITTAANEDPESMNCCYDDTTRVLNDSQLSSCTSNKDDNLNNKLNRCSKVTDCEEDTLHSGTGRWDNTNTAPSHAHGNRLDDTTDGSYTNQASGVNQKLVNGDPVSDDT